MNNNIKLLGGLFALVLSATACVNDGFGREDWETPSLVCHNKFDASTISLRDFVALAPKNGTITITEEHIVDGFVVSSDEDGSFYKTIVFQDKPENPTIGLQIEVNRSLNYADFPVGTHIRINTKGLVLGSDRGVVKLGYPDSQYPIGRLPETNLGNHISVVCVDGKADIVAIVPLELPSLKEASKDKYVNTLVSVSNVQFADSETLGIGGGKTYVDLPATADANRELVDKDGGTANLRIAQYASFGSNKLPEGNGKINFVVSKYNNKYQMIIRNLKDIDFSGKRIDTAPAKGGEQITYLSTGFTESFDGNISNYINDPIIGNRYWKVAQFSGNKYLQFGYSATGAKPYSRTFFAVPIDFDNMSGFSFKSKDGYNNGNVLKVYYSTDYQANKANIAMLEDITSSFTIASGSVNGFAANFTDSGIWNKPSSLNGKGFIIFEYLGGENLPTTTIQIDDITIH